MYFGVNYAFNNWDQQKAVTLFPPGRIAHWRFESPIEINEDSTFNIYQNSPLASNCKTDYLGWSFNDPNTVL